MIKKVLFSVAMVGLVAVAAHANVVQPTAVVSEEYVYAGAVQMIDNTDMTTPVNGGDTLASALAATHDFGGLYNGFISSDPGGYPSDFFASLPGGDTDIDIVLDLTGGGDTAIGSVLLWQSANNGGGAAAVGNHTRLIDIRINTEAEGDASFLGTATTVTILPVTDGDADPLNDLGGVNSAQAFALGTLTGRYALLSITDNYIGFQGIDGGGDRVGLSEVRFASEVIPEPATMILLGLGGLGLLRRRR